MMHFDQENGIVIRGLTNRRTTPDVLSHRASTLFADGLRTPPIAVNGDGATLVMPLIPGITGLKHFAALIQATAGWNQLADAQLDLLMKPMVALHRLPAHNLQLDEHQPFARIDARLHARRVRPELLPDLREARELLGRLTAATAQRQHRHATLIHGDYHPSQLILTLPNECPWLLDLEDLARGAPEVDLANLCAYVATNPSLAAGNPAQTLRHLLRRCAARYTALGGTIPRAELLHLHAAVTLLRRALKLEAAGADTASVNGILMLLHDILADQHLTSGAPMSTTAERQPKVAYVLKRFPRFSETFIVNELLELRRQGLDLEVYSLLRPPEEARHANLEQLDVPVTYLTVRNPVADTLLRATADGRRNERHTLEAALADLPDDPLVPGKDGRTIAHLHAQASAVALLARARGVTHLHAHFASNATTVAALASRLTGIPYSFTAHARDIYHAYVSPAIDNAARVRKIRGAAFAVTVSDYNARHLRALASVSTDRVRRLYNGIDLNRFRPAISKRATTRFIAVGRLVEKKGFRQLVDACALLARQPLPFTCHIVGDGPERETLHRHIVDCGLGDRIFLEGALPQERLTPFIAGATAMVLPCQVTASGDRDGLPTVLLEAMACGVPVLSTTVAGIPEIVDDGVNGFLVAPGDTLSLASRMQQLLADPELADRFGTAARSKAEATFDVRRNVAQLHDWFTACTPTHHHAAGDH